MFPHCHPCGPRCWEANAAARIVEWENRCKKVLRSESTSLNWSSLALSGYRVLYAEDGPNNQRLVSFVLNKAGADVALADNGQLAIEAIKIAIGNGYPFDIVLMDMQMPVLDGYEATRQLRNEHHWVPIIALTAHAMDGDCEKCIEARCDDYATQPVDRFALIEKVAQFYLPLRKTSKLANANG